MSETDTRDALREVFAATLGIAVDRLRPETRLGTDLELDSLDLLQLVFDVEERFGIEIPEGMVQQDQTFAELAALLDEALRQRADDAAGSATG